MLVKCTFILFFVLSILTQSLLMNICELCDCIQELNINYVTCNLTNDNQASKIYIANSQSDIDKIDTLVINYFSSNATRLPAGLLESMEIEYLTVKNQSFFSYDLALASVESVKNIYLANNSLYEIVFDNYSDNFKNSIECIGLNGNQLKVIPNLNELTNLNEIDLSKNLIEKINLNHMDGLFSLETVDLSFNCIIELKTSLFSSAVRASLKKLVLNHNKISELNDLHNFSSLNSLEISYNQINIIELLDLPELDELDLSHNRLGWIKQESLSNLTKLTSLDLSWNNLEWLNKNSFKNLKRLQNLYLQSNNLKSFSLIYLSSIFLIDLSSNRIKNIEYESNNYYENIKILRLSNNNLSRLNFLTHLPNIQFLYLDNNYLSEIPSDISTITKLDYVNNLLDFKYRKAWFISPRTIKFSNLDI